MRGVLISESACLALEGSFPAPMDGSWVEAEGLLEGGLLRVRELRLLTPALRSWPERPERNWQRWLAEPLFRRRVWIRGEVVHGIREFFRSRGFLEVDTPSLMLAPGMEPHLDPFETRLLHPDGRGRPAFLQTSPEYAMKKLLCAGIERIFQIAHVFRNGELSRTHQPEFSMLEWYRAFATYEDLMSDCEALLRFLAERLHGRPSLEVDGQTVDLSGPFERLPVARALGRYCLGREEVGPEILEPASIVEIARLRGLLWPGESADYQALFFQLLLNDVEPRLGRRKPTFLLDYPAWQGALARLRGPVAERVELYVAELELSNGFSELTDAREQRERFEAEREERRALGKPAFEPDPEFLGALELGMPPAAGMALGVDRLAALMCGTRDLGELTLLPFQEGF